MAHRSATSATAPTNRLAQELSPYLLQHAHNPVDWWPWGEAAFAEAKRRDVPVFVSIGYATCHWCHVMAHESFEDEAVAALMNAAFVNVKVDREERPDVDEAYMAVCQAMNGSGGWPLTVLLTPDKLPFFAGTYFPKASRHGRIGMLELVPKVEEAWRTQRPQLEAQARHILSHLDGTADHAHDEHGQAVAVANPSTGTGAGAGPDLGEAALAKGLEAFRKRFDAARGGFGGAPKFPSPHNLLFLLRMAHRTGDKGALAMVSRTLHAMADGGIHDHVGGGFHRYSTDAAWLLPHFEKMLYDQALVAWSYLEAFQATGDARFAEVARGTLDYVLRDLQDPAGGFRCAEDADSEGEEGKFYVWTQKELDAVLGEDAKPVIAAYGVAKEGNFHDEATRQLTGANILHVARPLPEVASALGIALPELRRRLAKARAKLLGVRSSRIRPLLDDKVLADWNGLAIVALAKAGVVLGEPRYTQAAQRAGDFLWARLRGPKGLRHRFKAGQTDQHGFLDDHAFTLLGFLELMDATQDPAWLTRAAQVAAWLPQFAAGDGSYRTAPNDGEALGIRKKDAYDGALPSGNSALAFGLARLGLLTGEARWTDAASGIVQAFASEVDDHPQAFAMMLCALDVLVGPTQEVVVAGTGPVAEAMVQEVRAAFRPRTTLLRASDALAQAAPWTRGHKPVGGKAAAYVCTGQACKRPATSVDELRAALAG